MERKPLLKRLLAGTLAVAVTVSSLTFSTLAAEDVNGTKLSLREVSNDAVSAALPGKETMSSSEEASYADNESVRVSIVLDDKSTIAKGFEVENIAQNTAAMKYRAELQTKQDNVVTKIEKATGEELDVVWKLTLAANLISANVEYGQIKDIERIKGVKEVLIETQYQPDVISEKPAVDPNMATSSTQIGSGLAWAAGYTGAGSRIAIVDTGTDTDHQSFSEEGFLHSLEVNAEKKGMTFEAYVASLNLLTKEEIDSVKDQLNVGTGKFKQDGGVIDPEKAYLNQKLPYAFSYVDNDYDITHDNDAQGEHGSHVAGIATANSYIKTENGFEPALTYAHMQGVAPDAQLLTLKVFGNNGGAYDSDYMAAIEDAIVLKADSINLSLGSGNPGRSRCSTAAYQEIMDNLTESGVVVAMSAGNSGAWPEYSNTLTGNLYADDASMQTDGSPGSYTNSFTVASIDNIGYTGTYIEAADGSVIFYGDTAIGYGFNFDPFTTLKGEQSYIFIDGFGTPEDWDTLSDVLKGKVAICSRGGGVNFVDKANDAIRNGAIATVIYNNVPGSILIGANGYNYTAPYITITPDDAAILKANAEEKKTAGGYVYYEGTLVSHDDVVSGITNSGSTMSDFSSWGVPGSLQLKPEITAPGGDIYSVNGLIPGGKDYENMSGTSMASPQIAGLSAVAAQYVREAGLAEKTGESPRTLIQSLIMSTATPVFESVAVDVDEETGDYIYGDFYYPVIRQGAGLANISNLINAASYILMGEDATVSANDGKVKAELGDDPERKGEYTFSFSINNITDEPVAYNLSADLFTQGYYPYYVNEDGDVGYYMDTATMDMDADAVFECDGETVATVVVPANGSKTVTVTLTLSEDQKAELDYVFENGAYVEGFVFASPAKSYDFNNDGKVDELDGQAILDYRTTVRDILYNAENADMDDDGDIDTRDAYLFLEALANGELDLGEEIEGITHSIPVLGFYGNWTDPSMFDVGTRLEYKSGEETRNPYLGNKNVNSFGITYADESGKTYYFGGNPVVNEPYDESRNAMNANDVISLAQFAAIRNADASFFRVLKDGSVVTSESFGAIDAAFYYTNQQRWYYTSNAEQLDFVPANYGLKNDDSITLDLVLVPEYYIDDDGNVSLDGVGEGAHMSIPVTIDNEKPNIVGGAVYDEKTQTITVTANDNNYVAGVVLYNRPGTTLLSYDRAKSDIDKGADAEYVLSTEGVKGKQFIIQVIDYANNIRTYVCEEDVGSDIPMPEMMALNTIIGNYWFSIEDTGVENVKDFDLYMPANHNYVAATIADHYVFAITDEGELYVMPEDDLDDLHYINDIPDDIFDLAYNPVDGKLYGVSYIGGLSLIISIDKLTGNVEDEFYLFDNAITLACDENGVFYYNPVETDSIYTFTLDDLLYGIMIQPEKLCESTGIGASDWYRQAMEIDPNREGVLCWLSLTDREAYYVEVNTATGAATKFNDLMFQFYSLVIPDRAPVTAEPEWAKPATDATEVIISNTAVSLFEDNQTQLSANVLPWTLPDRSVKWSSSDETVATVSANGTITALNVGECEIIATASATNTVTASCKVKVEKVEATITGALQDKDGIAQFYEWNMGTDETWTGTETLSISGDITSSTISDKYVYIGTSDDIIYVLDPKTGEVIDSASGLGESLADMAYSTYMSTPDQPLVAAVIDSFFGVPCDPMNLIEMSGFDMSAEMGMIGSNFFIAIASMGQSEFYDPEDGEVYDVERFVAIDNLGYVWSMYYNEYPETESMIFAGGIRNSTLPADFLGSNTYGEYCSLACGEDGYLYLSAHDGNTNNIYRIELDDVNGEALAAYMGNVGDGVWPAVILTADSNVKANASADKVTNSLIKEEYTFRGERVLEKVSVDTPAAMTTRSVKPAKHVKTVTTAKSAEKNTRSANGVAVLNNSAAVLAGDNEVETTVEGFDASVNDMTITLDGNKENGLFLINYDPEVLTLGESNIEINAEYTSFKLDAENGKLIVGYVYGDSDADVLVLNFDVNSDTTATSTIVNVVNAEAGELDIIPVDVDVDTYDPATDGISDSAKELGVSEEVVNELLVGEIEIVLASEPPASEPPASEPDVSEPADTTAPDVTTGGDDNKPTGFAFCIVPAAVSAIAVLASKKRRK